MRVPLKNAIIIPQKATYEMQGRTYVFVVGKDGVVTSCNIQISASLDDIYVVQSGLKASDQILLEGVQKVNEDDKIKYEIQDPKEVLSHLSLKAE